MCIGCGEVLDSRGHSEKPQMERGDVWGSSVTVEGDEGPAWNLYVKYDANERLLLFDSTTVFHWCFLGDAHSSVSQAPVLAQRPSLLALSHDYTALSPLVSSQVPGELGRAC